MPSTTPPRDRPLAALRAATAGSHRRLEARLGILSRPWSAGDYRHLLAGFFTVHTGLERWIAGSVPAARAAAWGLDRRRRSAHLARDLNFLGASGAELAALPSCSPPAHWCGAADALGCLYVLEGATLGGVVLARHFARVGGWVAGAGGDFFGGYGPRTPAMWRAWRATLAAELQDPADLTRACRAAAETFALFESVLAPGPPAAADGAPWTAPPPPR